ncbi:hypothetical protein HB364_31025 [Pseudoflavitalea sp. X16]|uniref:hypothetical protein n=1 Tax=Paraflavitalea devenefica TaxID=2716334 RepID=UPI001420D009|nr:hypothetical protein [Paraflavitalea devenefica]NII29553.1 hypothetical protein [Paraflavitalea devenefica]
MNWKYILPPFVIDLSRKVNGYLSYLSQRRHILHNTALKDKYKDQRVFILATGPSIKQQDLRLLQHEKCIAVSNFFVHEDYKTIAPFLHVFASTHAPLTEQQIVSWFKEADEKIPGTSTVLLALHDKQYCDRHRIFQTKDHYYYLSKFGNFPVNLAHNLPSYQTVVQLAIYAAIYMGFTEINLLGVDHSWILHYGESRHFYEEKEHKFTQNGYSEWIDDHLGDEFKKYVILWEQYEEIIRNYKNSGIAIYNLSPESLLDLFPKKAFSQALSKK